MRRTDEHAPRTTRRGPPPMLIEALFYVFAAILVAASLAVITARNPVYSALALVMCFVTSAAIWLLLEAEFLGGAGAGVRRRRHGAVPVRGHDARHQPGGAAPGVHALRLARLAHGARG